MKAVQCQIVASRWRQSCIIDLDRNDLREFGHDVIPNRTLVTVSEERHYKRNGDQNVMSVCLHCDLKTCKVSPFLSVYLFFL